MMLELRCNGRISRSSSYSSPTLLSLYPPWQPKKLSVELLFPNKSMICSQIFTSFRSKKFDNASDPNRFFYIKFDIWFVFFERRSSENIIRNLVTFKNRSE